MAGADPTGAFNATTFRNAIHAVMTLSLPNTKSDQPTFQWLPDPTYSVADNAGNPYDWTATPSVANTIPDLQVTCAVTYSQSEQFGTDAGEINTEKIVLTILDVDYQLLLTNGNGTPPDQVVVDNVTYTIDYINLQALYTVDVYSMHASSVDE
jgi:hypothetical protein